MMKYGLCQVKYDISQKFLLKLSSIFRQQRSGAAASLVVRPARLRQGGQEEGRQEAAGLVRPGGLGRR